MSREIVAKPSEASENRQLFAVIGQVSQEGGIGVSGHPLEAKNGVAAASAVFKDRARVAAVRFGPL